MTQLSIEQIHSKTESIVDQMKDLPGGLLPILHGLQDTLGYVPEESVSVLAKRLNLSRADVHGVITFYHHFRRTPPGKRTLYVCRSEACQSMGGTSIETHAKKVLGVDWHQTSDDQEISLEPIYCLGNCACAPTVMLDERVIGRVTPKVLEDLIADAKNS